MLRAIVFDFDGVIANSEPLHLRALQETLAPEGIVISEVDYYARYLGFDDVGSLRRIAMDHRRTWTDAEISTFVARKGIVLENLERDVSMLFPGAADTIRRASAVAPLAITSGARAEEIRRVLDRERLADLFAVIVSADDTAVSKPSPEPYLHTVARLSDKTRQRIAAHECVAIEDSIWGLESARAAGLRTVAVAQTYPARDLACADIVISSIEALDVRALATLCSM